MIAPPPDPRLSCVATMNRKSPAMTVPNSPVASRSKRIRRVDGSVVGALALDNLQRFTFSVAFLGVSGFSELGVSVGSLSEAAVKQHLAHLYDKFGIQGGGERRRVRLANEALRRGAVTMAGLRQEVARDGKRPR